MRFGGDGFFGDTDVRGVKGVRCLRCGAGDFVAWPAFLSLSSRASAVLPLEDAQAPVRVHVRVGAAQRVGQPAARLHVLAHTLSNTAAW